MTLQKAIAANTQARERLASAIDAMSEAASGQEPRGALAASICVAFVGDRSNPDGGPCLRCKGTGADPDPAASTGIGVAS